MSGFSEDGEASRPTHRDKAAMNVAQPIVLFRKVCKRTIDDRATRPRPMRPGMLAAMGLQGIQPESE